MFGSTNHFAQSPSSPFRSMPGFGLTSTDPFAPRPSGGSSSPFGTQTGSSVFGGTSPGAFGEFARSPSNCFGSTPGFGLTRTEPFAPKPFHSSSSPFGSQMGSSMFASTSSTIFDGTSVTGQEAAFAGFGSTPSQASSFGSTFQQTQPAFGSNLFGSSTGFGIPNQPTFGATSQRVIGSTSVPAFGAKTIPAFGTTTMPNFGSITNPTFGRTSTPLLGSTGKRFGVSTAPMLGLNTRAFDAPTSTLFRSASTAFGSDCTPSFGYGTASSFGQSNFRSEMTPSPFVTQSPYAAQVTIPTFGSSRFGQSTFGGQPGGSRATTFTPTPEADTGSATQPSPFQKKMQTAGKLMSISAMPLYKDKSNEEMRWEDYQCCDKGGAKPSGQSAGGITSPAPSQGGPSPFTRFVANPLLPSTTSSVFAPKTPSFSSSSIFIGPTVSSTFVEPTVSASSSSFVSCQTIGNARSSWLSPSSTSPIGQTVPPFGQPSTGFQPTTSGFESNSSKAPSAVCGGYPTNRSTPSVLPTTPPTSFSSSIQTPATLQTSSTMTINNSGQEQPGGFCSIFNQGTSVRSTAATLSNIDVQLSPITNPFGVLPAMPQSSVTVQYGISSIPVPEKPSLIRIPSLLTPRHASQRRIRLPARKYHPKSDDQRVPFFFSDETTPKRPMADVLRIPREHPRALIIYPVEQYTLGTNGEEQSILKDTHPTNGSGKGRVLREPSPEGVDESFAGYCDESENNNASSPSEPLQSPNVADIEALIPKLCITDYYTEPGTLELAAKERAEPGFCRHVKDFVVGRQGYGSIKFSGETDVRGLDIQSIVQFNNREVIVYKDDSKKPSVGQGLNKPAEVTLLNVKCMNKKTGQQYSEGPKVDRYKEMLMKTTEEQGAEFLSYDPVEGEWKFKVKQF